MSTKAISEAMGRSVCAGASSSLLTLGALSERWMGIQDVQERERMFLPSFQLTQAAESRFTKNDLNTVCECVDGFFLSGLVLNCSILIPALPESCVDVFASCLTKQHKLDTCKNWKNYKTTIWNGLKDHSIFWFFETISRLLR